MYQLPIIAKGSVPFSGYRELIELLRKRNSSNSVRTLMWQDQFLVCQLISKCFINL